MPDSIQFSKPLHIPVLTGLYVDNVPLNASQSTLHPEDLIDTSSVYTNNLYFIPKAILILLSFLHLIFIIRGILISSIV